MKVGQRVNHPVYGPGTVIAVTQGQSQEVFKGEVVLPILEDHKLPSRYTLESNGWTRYTDNLNIAVKFDNGGPLGWASNSSNDVKELEIQDEPS